MSEVPKSLIFNADPADAAQPNPAAVFVPSADPYTKLALDGAEVAKVPRQRTRLDALTLPPTEPDPFGASLSWAYRCYRRIQPTNNQIFQDYLYLFNVIVALEWEPGADDRAALELAFRHASDFLFDITDGWMAFGQVVIGGPTLMDCADIQIMASTRIHPRSWVGAMHAHAEYPNDEKYSPIRIGRGLWSDTLRATIEWGEPEAYRILVHEWCHYALALTDEYLEVRQLLVAGDQPQPAPNELADMPTVAVVTLNLPSTTDSIMASTEGTSELITAQWAKLHARFPHIPVERAEQARSGPARLPAALPRFRTVATEPAEEYLLPSWRALRDTLHRVGLPEATAPERCWLYLLKGLNASQHTLAPDARLIAQGTLEARSATRQFALKGAAQGDTIVLIGSSRDAPPTVLAAPVPATGLPQWRAAGPAACPAIDIVAGAAAPNATLAAVQLRARMLGPNATAPAPQQIGLFPMGAGNTLVAAAPAAGQLSAAHNLGTLDGHALLVWADGSLLIGTFSQGGDGPNSSYPFPANPMNAGSGDGQAMLFMYKPGPDEQAPNDIKVVTMLAHGLGGPPAGWRERSYTFAVSSNHALPQRFNPTLSIYFDVFDPLYSSGAAGGLRIARWTSAGWVAVPTYIPPGFRFAIAPLDAHAGGSLIELAASAPRVEYYRVCWVPH